MGQTLQLHVPYLHNRTVGTIVDLLLHIKLPQQRLPAKEAARHVQVPGEGANNAMGEAAQHIVWLWLSLLLSAAAARSRACAAVRVLRCA